MTCKWCGSGKQSRFAAEVAIHSPGLNGLNKPIVWVFPELFLCLNCGKAEFVVHDNDLLLYAGSDFIGETFVSTTPTCKSCGSGNLGNFRTEIVIHFPGRKNLSKPHVFVFPELLVCFDCGIAALTVPEAELRQLAEGREAGAERINDS